MDIFFNRHIYSGRILSDDAVQWSRVSSLISSLAEQGADWVNWNIEGLLDSSVKKAVQLVEWLARFEDLAEGQSPMHVRRNSAEHSRPKTRSAGPSVKQYSQETWKKPNDNFSAPGLRFTSAIVLGIPRFIWPPTSLRH